MKRTPVQTTTPPLFVIYFRWLPSTLVEERTRGTDLVVKDFNVYQEIWKGFVFRSLNFTPKLFTRFYGKRLILLTVNKSKLLKCQPCCKVTRPRVYLFILVRWNFDINRIKFLQFSVQLLKKKQRKSSKSKTKSCGAWFRCSGSDLQLPTLFSSICYSRGVLFTFQCRNTRVSNWYVQSARNSLIKDFNVSIPDRSTVRTYIRIKYFYNSEMKSLKLHVRTMDPRNNLFHQGP